MFYRKDQAGDTNCKFIITYDLQADLILILMLINIMEKIILHVNDNKVEFIKELLSHFYFVKIAGSEKLKESRVYAGGNFEINSGTADPDEMDETKNATLTNEPEMSEIDVRNLKQLRDALNMIDSIRDKNK